ncbi:hypothetical protein [Sphingomonas soli]|uniref:hypothetical protein n=1 Tax=Sphingomonas soli TaxID=266127 RepID=UPI0008374F1F|nr:hypothetical protein [Sphingomonas soli]
MPGKRLRWPARAARIAIFVLVELLGIAAAFGIAAIRCCGAGGPVVPQDAGEWIGLALLVIGLLLLGLALAALVALLVEGVQRIAERSARR